MAVFDILMEVADVFWSWRVYLCLIPAILLACQLHDQWPEAGWLGFLTVPSVVGALVVCIRWDYRSSYVMGRLPAERVTPIHELLARIRHDREFGSGRFELGYFDRCEGTVHRVAWKEIGFPADERRVFELVDETGRMRRIPFHRVREVYRDGERIWHRPG